jgi:hypothetical protein
MSEINREAFHLPQFVLKGFHHALHEIILLARYWLSITRE